MLSDAPVQSQEMVSLVISDFPTEMQYAGFNRSSHGTLHGSEPAQLKVHSKTLLELCTTSTSYDAAMALGICEGCFIGLGLGVVEVDGQKLSFVCRDILKNELCFIGMTKTLTFSVGHVVGQVTAYSAHFSYEFDLL